MRAELFRHFLFLSQVHLAAQASRCPRVPHIIYLRYFPQAHFQACFSDIQPIFFQALSAFLIFLLHWYNVSYHRLYGSFQFQLLTY